MMDNNSKDNSEDSGGRTIMEEESIRFTEDITAIDESIHMTGDLQGAKSCTAASRSSLLGTGSNHNKLVSFATGSNHNKSVSFATGSNHNKSVSFATAGASPTTSSPPKSPGRLATIKAKLRDSFYADESFQRSWGGALNHMDDVSSSRNSDDDDDDSFGADAFGDMDTSRMDASETQFRAKARRESTSFNMSFMNIGLQEEEDDGGLITWNRGGKVGMRDNSMADASCKAHTGGRPRRATGRGSIFVIADEKLANTKVIRSRLERAAKKLQRFFRRSLLVLRRYNEERIYLQGEVQDTESRRLEELTDIRQFIREEKEQFKMELEQEWNGNHMTQEEWDERHREQDEMREQVAELKASKAAIKKDGRALLFENNKLELDGDDPEREAERVRLEKEVEKLSMDIEDWERIGSHYTIAIDEAETKMEALTEKRKAKRAERKKTEKAIKKIVEWLEEKQMEENPKLVEKVAKLKTKREKKMRKLKERTIMEQQGQLPPQEQPEPEQEYEEQPTKPRKQKRSKQAEDLPSLEKMDREQSQPETPNEPSQEKCQQEAKEKEKKKKKDKKQKKDKKKEKKDKKGEELVLKRQESVDGDEALRMIYEAEQKKKGQAKLEKDRDVANIGGPSALMSLITG